MDNLPDDLTNYGLPEIKQTIATPPCKQPKPESLANVDCYDLLKKYMAHVIECESFSLLHYTGMFPDSLTQEELNHLKTIEELVKNEQIP